MLSLSYIRTQICTTWKCMKTFNQDKSKVIRGITDFTLLGQGISLIICHKALNIINIIIPKLEICNTSTLDPTQATRFITDQEVVEFSHLQEVEETFAVPWILIMVEKYSRVTMRLKCTWRTNITCHTNQFIMIHICLPSIPNLISSSSRKTPSWFPSVNSVQTQQKQNSREMMRCTWTKRIKKFTTTCKLNHLPTQVGCSEEAEASAMTTKTQSVMISVNS